MPILTDQERIGTLLGERYRVEAILGRGGMGVVFRARQEDNGLPVAVKILRPELAQQDPQFAKRFVREARAAAAVRHPNVVEILDVGEEPDGTIYQVLELLVGESLREHLERKERLDPTMMLELLLPVMNALEAAHAAGIVHRDLKPDNIFLARQPSGEAKPTLLDFGIAKLLDTRGGSFATNTGSIMGTPAYMAPEQAGGYKDQGPAIDVWAMGIIAFECLTGSPPFHGSSPAHVMLKIMTEAPPPVDTVVAEIPVGISQAIEKALQRTPADRHHTMAAFRGALRVAAEREGLELPAEGRASTTRVLSIAPRPEEDVASAETDAAVSAKPVSDSGEGFATMQRKLREDRREREQRARADAATRLSTPSSKSANDSIEVSIAAPETRPRWLWLGAAALVVAVLGVGAGLTLAGGGGAPAVTTSSAPPSTTSVVPPPSPPPTTSVPAATQRGEPPTTSDPGVTTPPPTIEPPTTARIRVPRGGGTSMSTAMVEAPATTMEAVTMEAVSMEPGTMETTMRGGLPSVVGWEDE